MTRIELEEKAWVSYDRGHGIFDWDATLRVGPETSYERWGQNGLDVVFYDGNHAEVIGQARIKREFSDIVHSHVNR